MILDFRFWIFDYRLTGGWGGGLAMPRLKEPWTAPHSPAM